MGAVNEKPLALAAPVVLQPVVLQAEASTSSDGQLCVPQHLEPRDDQPRIHVRLPAVVHTRCGQLYTPGNGCKI